MALVDQIIGVESGGNADARNPNSSAGGLGQFIDSTWLSMVAKHRPDLAEGRSPQEILALKSDPSLSRQMTEAYAADNGLALQNAGFEANPANTYLAHFAGPQGAVKVLSADPSTPVEAVLGQGAVNANPFLRGMTAADLQGWAARKMGGAPSQPAQASLVSPPASVSASLPPAPPALPPAAQAPVEAATSLFGQMPAGRTAGIEAPPIFYARRKPPDISQLRAALEASGNRGLFFGG